MIENYENYINYLKFLNEKLSKFFIMQKPYIFCKKGCSLCCKNVQLPYSKIEFEFLMSGAAQLDEDTKNIVKQNIKNILAGKEKFHGPRAHEENRRHRRARQHRTPAREAAPGL